jgi:cobalamin biosynthesis protein CobW
MKIPALIVSGFLGSGKTTLVGHLLDQARKDGVRLAIVSNEFGDTGIDRALLDAGEDGFVELDGGCVCCRLSDALGETVENVITKARPDRLVLETSGLAIPGEVVLAFWREPIEPFVSEVTVVVVVDGERFLAPDVDELVFEQLEAADLVLLNKCDLLDDAAIAVAEARIVEVSGGQPVIRTVRCAVDATLLFPTTPTGRPAPAAHEDHDHGHDRFDSVVRAFPDVIEEAALIALLVAEDAIRVKGFVRTPAGIRVVQGVGPRIELVEPRVPVREDLVGKVVVIRRV